MKRLLLIAAALSTLSATAQTELKQAGSRLTDSLLYRAEVQTTLSAGDHTPLWLNANRYGLSSLKTANGYVRGALTRPIARDSMRRWGVGYGLDVAVAAGFTSTLVVQQAYGEVRWLKGLLTVGSKEQPMELKNQELSSGAQTLGVNARPVPQVRLSLPDYWTVPGTRGWVGLKGHIAYGRTTDDGWQKDFTGQKSKYTADTWYHSKAGYLRIGKAGKPFSVEMGLEMAAQFGGTTYLQSPDYPVVDNGGGLKAFFHALIPGGGETVEEETYKNDEGNQLGSWLLRLNYETPCWKLSLYGDKYFEDHSSMFQLDYDGYGEGDEWNKKTRSRFLLYDLKDMMLGVELELKHGTWLRNVVLEYLYTKYQCGPVYHDRTPSYSDHIGGIDDYYYHYVFTGWQHWGQVMGNPLYLSPLYNSDGEITVKNNRFVAWHLGLSGQPTERLHYRLLASWHDGLGRYKDPYTHTKYNTSVMAEAAYQLNRGWSLTAAVGADFGDIRGDNTGLQLTVTKKGVFK